MDTHSKFPLAILFFIVLSSCTCLGQNSPQDYLDAHNVVRSQVGVENLVWDDKVAAFAQNYVKTLLGDCKLVHSNTNDYGENLAGGGTGKDAVNMWVGEKKFYNHDSNTCAAGGVCGHYTQVVWRNSVRLGCARARCNDGTMWIISCNYDPPGNYIGESPY